VARSIRCQGARRFILPRLRLLLIVLTITLLLPAVASAAFSARVSGLPTVQRIGQRYPFVITVTNRGPWIKFFCIDFNDDDNSWLIKGPAPLAKYPKSDGFCARTLKKETRRFSFVLIPASQGAHKLEIILGKGHLYKAIQKVLVDDKNALSWSEEFVLS
jgi:hypothetical protein